MGDRRKKRRSWWKDVADSGGDVAGANAEAVSDGCLSGDGCLGCEINLMIAFVLLAGIPLLLWTS